MSTVDSTLTLEAALQVLDTNGRGIPKLRFKQLKVAKPVLAAYYYWNIPQWNDAEIWQSCDSRTFVCASRDGSGVQKFADEMGAVKRKILHWFGHNVW